MPEEAREWKEVPRTPSNRFYWANRKSEYETTEYLIVNLYADPACCGSKIIGTFDCVVLKGKSIPDYVLQALKRTLINTHGAQWCNGYRTSFTLNHIQLEFPHIRQLVKFLEDECGFVKGGRFRNRNTGAYVTFWSRHEEAK